MAFMVLAVTNGAFLVSKYAGINNIASVAAIYAAGKYIHPYFFFAVTSYTHYCMYIATYHVREGINFGTFKRNVMFWKSLALTHLGLTYLKHFEFDIVSIAMIVCGYGLSTAATVALGIDQTYFGVELGKVKPNFVHGFPYNVVPHPMIIGSMVGLLGFHKMAGFRAALPYAIPSALRDVLRAHVPGTVQRHLRRQLGEFSGRQGESCGACANSRAKDI